MAIGWFPVDLISFLLEKLRSARFIVAWYADASCRRYPGAVVGNKTYAHLREQRVRAALADLMCFSKNCIFLTLTRRYAKNYAGRVESWQWFQTNIGKYLRILKRYGLKSYICVFESHFEGGCHAHVVIKLDYPVEAYFDLLEQKWRLSMPDLEERMRREWLKLGGGGGLVEHEGDWMPEAADDHGFEAKPVTSEWVGNYLSKELGKGSQIENSLRRADRDWAHEGDEDGDGEPGKKKQKRKDVQKLQAHYYSSKLKIRLLRVSKDLQALDVPESVESDEAGEEASVTEMNKSTDLVGEHGEIIKTAIVPAWLKAKKGCFEPYTGWVTPGSSEYEALEKLLWGASGAPKRRAPVNGIGDIVSSVAARVELISWLLVGGEWVGW